MKVLRFMVESYFPQAIFNLQFSRFKSKKLLNLAIGKTEYPSTGSSLEVPGPCLMNLAMFDIDGTLTQTFAVDSECYVRAVKEVGGFEDISTDWATYQHTSDSGILDELYRTRLGRPPTPEETADVRRIFVDFLRQAAVAPGSAFAAVPGAREFVEDLIASGHADSLASGGWRESALLKLAAANLKLDGMPAAFADDAQSRDEIMTCSYQHACVAHGAAKFEKVVYVGDGVWDAKAARRLGNRFIGVGEGERARRLIELGAVATLADYSDLAAAREKIAFAFGSGQNASRV